MNIIVNILAGTMIVIFGCYAMGYNTMNFGIMAFVGGWILIGYTIFKANWKIDREQDHRIAKDLVHEAIYMFGDNKDAEEYLELIANRNGLDDPDYAVTIWEEWEAYHEIKKSLNEIQVKPEVSQE